MATSRGIILQNSTLVEISKTLFSEKFCAEGAGEVVMLESQRKKKMFELEKVYTLQIFVFFDEFILSGVCLNLNIVIEITCVFTNRFWAEKKVEF